jgi:ribonuclease P protein component
VAAGPGVATETRIGLVVGKRVGNAVVRNRAKRRLRHALKQIPLEQGMDYVIIAEREVLDLPFESLVGRLADAVAACR